MLTLILAFAVGVVITAIVAVGCLLLLTSRVTCVTPADASSDRRGGGPQGHDGGKSAVAESPEVVSAWGPDQQLFHTGECFETATWLNELLAFATNDVLMAHGQGAAHLEAWIACQFDAAAAAANPFAHEAPRPRSRGTPRWPPSSSGSVPPPNEAGNSVSSKSHVAAAVYSASSSSSVSPVAVPVASVTPPLDVDAKDGPSRPSGQRGVSQPNSVTMGGDVAAQQPAATAFAPFVRAARLDQLRLTATPLTEVIGHVRCCRVALPPPCHDATARSSRRVDGADPSGDVPCGLTPAVEIEFPLQCVWRLSCDVGAEVGIALMRAAAPRSSGDGANHTVTAAVEPSNAADSDVASAAGGDPTPAASRSGAVKRGVATATAAVRVRVAPASSATSALSSTATAVTTTAGVAAANRGAAAGMRRLPLFPPVSSPSCVPLCSATLRGMLDGAVVSGTLVLRMSAARGLEIFFRDLPRIDIDVAWGLQRRGSDGGLAMTGDKGKELVQLAVARQLRRLLQAKLPFRWPSSPRPVAATT